MELDTNNLKQFILTYKQHTLLWDVSEINYMNRRKRHAALQDLLPLLGEKATLEMVRKKIDILRTTYFREWRKVQASKATASCPSDVYTPTLWYYNLLTFLSKEDESKTDSFDELETENKSYLYALLTESTDKDSSSITKKKQSTDCQDNFLFVDETQLVVNDKEIDNEKIRRKEKAQMRKIRSELTKLSKKAKREFSYGLYLSQQLQQNVSHDQRTFAEKLMSDILYMARTNQLNATSQIITPLETSFLSDNSDYD